MKNKKIRVCYTLNTFEIGGAETVTLELARSHNVDKYEVEVVALIEPQSSGESEMRRRFGEAGVKTTVIRQANYKSLISLWRIYWFLKRGNFDIVLGHNRGSDYWGALVGRFAGIPHQYWTRHLSYQDFSAKQIRRYASLSKRISRVVAVSETVRNACICIEGVPDDKVVTILNGIDTTKYAPISAHTRQLKREEVSIAKDECFLLFVGRFSEQKAPEAFVELVWKLREGGHAMRGIMCGYGPLEDKLHGMVANGPEGISILGLRSDIPELLGACDLFVSTSRNEGLPLNVMEAMAAGAPFVGPAISQVGELVDGVSDLENRLYSPPPKSGGLLEHQVEEWALKVVEVLELDANSDRASLAGRKAIEEKFSLARMVAEYEKLFESDLENLKH